MRCMTIAKLSAKPTEFVRFISSALLSIYWSVWHRKWRRLQPNSFDQATFCWANRRLTNHSVLPSSLGWCAKRSGHAFCDYSLHGPFWSSIELASTSDECALCNRVNGIRFLFYSVVETVWASVNTEQCTLNWLRTCCLSATHSYCSFRAINAMRRITTTKRNESRRQSSKHTHQRLYRRHEYTIWIRILNIFKQPESTNETREKILRTSLFLAYINFVLLILRVDRLEESSFMCACR